MSNYSIEDEVLSLEKALGLPNGFFHKLIEEDDWSFVIKLHALIEAAVTHALVHKTGVEGLLNVFSMVELSKPKTGKLAFAKALGILDRDERRFIRNLSELRNDLVHKITNVAFKFEEYVVGLDAKQRKAFCDAFGYGWDDPVVIRGRSIERGQFTLDNPKICISRGAMCCLALIYLEKQTAVFQHKAARLLMENLDLRLEGENLKGRSSTGAAGDGSK